VETWVEAEQVETKTKSKTKSKNEIKNSNLTSVWVIKYFL